jgi:hypothetical protein
VSSQDHRVIDLTTDREIKDNIVRLTQCSLRTCHVHMNPHILPESVVSLASAIHISAPLMLIIRPAHKSRNPSTSSFAAFNEQHHIDILKLDSVCFSFIPDLDMNETNPVNSR